MSIQDEARYHTTYIDSLAVLSDATNQYRPNEREFINAADGKPRRCWRNPSNSRIDDPTAGVPHGM